MVVEAKSEVKVTLPSTEWLKSLGKVLATVSGIVAIFWGTHNTVNLKVDELRSERTELSRDLRQELDKDLRELRDELKAHRIEIQNQKIEIEVLRRAVVASRPKTKD